MTVCLIAAVGGLPVFASGNAEGSNALWYKAADIVDASSSVLPAEKNVVWEEMNPAGQVVSTAEFTLYYGEGRSYVFSEQSNELLSGQGLSFNIAGDIDAAAKRSTVNDSLFWTPFDDDAADADVKVVNTGAVESIGGRECSVFEYTMYRDAAQFGYNFEETVRDSHLLLDDYEDPESSTFIKVEGRAWIDGSGVLRQLESNINSADADYCETVNYEYNGSELYPVESVIEGTLEVTAGTMVASTSFRATETMTGHWTATDFFR